MRCLYREQIYECGDYLEVNIFPAFKKAQSRGKRAKVTSEVQARLNEHNAEQQLIRLLNANFSGDDYELHLTYTDENLPEDDDIAARDIKNMMRRCKRLYHKSDIELKYVYVTEGGVGETRYHYHVTLSGGVDRTELERLWGYGYANCRQLQFNENGVEGLAKYVTKQFRAHKDELVFRKRWCGSKNLIKPEPKVRDGKLSQRKVQALATYDAESRRAFEAIYDGYYLSEAKPFYNDVNGGYYIHVKMYRKDAVFANTKKRRKRKDEKHEMSKMSESR